MAKKRQASRPPRRAVREAQQKQTSLREQQAQNTRVHVLGLMRTGLSFTQAIKHASEIGARVGPRSVKRAIGSALIKEPNGRWKAKPSDRLLRYLPFITAEGAPTVPVRGSKQASLVGRHEAAVKQYLAGDPEPLRKFEGKFLKIGKEQLPFITDPEFLEQLYYKGQLGGFDSFYGITAAR